MRAGEHRPDGATSGGGEATAASARSAPSESPNGRLSAFVVDDPALTTQEREDQELVDRRRSGNLVFEVDAAPREPTDLSLPVSAPDLWWLEVELSESGSLQRATLLSTSGTIGCGRLMGRLRKRDEAPSRSAAHWDILIDPASITGPPLRDEHGLPPVWPDGPITWDEGRLCARVHRREDGCATRIELTIRTS